MKIEKIFCDFCKIEFKNLYWDEQPCKIDVLLSNPAQSYESRSFEHVCKFCRTKLIDLIDDFFKRAHIQ